mmetsp:Transcript_17382/g.19494  ORF Transcript_17382/g.19494 Transcript_17382/m.19494 type:complete len:250 (-) Transcript_17382:450-1199(-)
MVKHNTATQHPIALSFSDFSFWCYTCDTYVVSTKFHKVHEHFYKQKFGDTSKDDIIGIISKIAELDINEEEKKEEAPTEVESNFPEKEKRLEDAETTEEKDDKPSEEDKKEEEKAFTREEFIQKLKNGDYKRIALLTGAGISVSAGIPDFRSPKTGLYATLKGKYDMDDPAEIFSLKTFLEKPEIFYDFAKELDWDKYIATPTHYFIGFLHHKGLLDINFTQNIDGLELKAGIPEEKVVAAHGNLTGAH